MANDTRIKSLEDLVINLGYNTSDVEAINEIVRKKNVDIETLKKQLKLPSTEDPHTKEMGELEKKKEGMFKIIIEQNIQIREMEVELEKLLKEKEKSSKLAIFPLTTMLISVVGTTEDSTSTKITAQTTDSSNELIKSMQEMIL